jgi:hypothetical protein
MNRVLIPIAFALASAAFAQDAPDTIEALSVIRDSETARLDQQTIQQRGDVTRFDVRVQPRDPEQQATDAPAGRFIRYVARCGEKSMGVAAVATIDRQGKMLKSYVVPPGAADFAVPADGSMEARWLAEACR